MAKLKTLKDKINEYANDPEFQAEKEKLKPEFEVVRLLIEIRQEKGISQEELAEILKQAQSDTAHLDKEEPLLSVRALFALAKATGKELQIRLV